MAILSNSAAQRPETQESAPSETPIKDFFREHPGSVAGLGAGLLLGTIGYLYKRDIPVQLKIIQGRIVAQGALLAGCSLAAAHHFLVDEPAAALKGARVDHSMDRLRKFDVPVVGEGEHDGPAPVSVAGATMQ